MSHEAGERKAAISEVETAAFLSSEAAIAPPSLDKKQKGGSKSLPTAPLPHKKGGARHRIDTKREEKGGASLT
jgi:hypothetical protein